MSIEVLTGWVDDINENVAQCSIWNPKKGIHFHVELLSELLMKKNIRKGQKFSCVVHTMLYYPPKYKQAHKIQSVEIRSEPQPCNAALNEILESIIAMGEK